MSSIARALFNAVALFNGDTRQQAWEAIKPHKTRLQTLVLEHLEVHGPCTTEEIELGLELSHQSVSPRVGELRDKGLIVECGQRKTRSNRNAIVWGLRDELSAGQAAAKS